MMRDRHDPVDDMGLIDPVDAEDLAEAWSQSEAKQVLHELIISSPVEEPSDRRAAVPRRRVVPAIVLGMMISGAAGAYAGSAYLGSEDAEAPVHWRIIDGVPQIIDDEPSSEDGADVVDVVCPDLEGTETTMRLQVTDGDVQIFVEEGDRTSREGSRVFEVTCRTIDVSSVGEDD